MANGRFHPEHVDVLILGAGLSGVGSACHLQRKHPQRSYAILEARDAIGGTWDLFRYPGIRSDSDMHTLGYNFRPWKNAKAIADGPSIREYVRDTARENGVDKHIRFGHRVIRAEWSSEASRWTVEAERTDSGERVQMTCNFLFACTGYYRYDQGYSPHFEGTDRFKGEIVHPQHWPEDFDYDGKRVVVIGSGATAVTLVPAMAERAAHVTMLQRSPSYYVSLPAIDRIAEWLRSRLPEKRAYAVIRWKNVMLQMVSFQLSRRWPEFVKKLMKKGVERHLPEGFDVDRHFTPNYDPWDQRLCVVPDADLFEAISAGRASIATDAVETFTENGVRLASGEEIEADVIVTATGLNLRVLGGMQIAVDGEQVNMPDAVAYKGLMLCGVPNLAMTFGYTNASWTLRCDLVAGYVCRLLSHMDEHGYGVATPRWPDPSIERRPYIDLNSGYVLRTINELPKQAGQMPWTVYQNYIKDIGTLRRGPVDDEMDFSRGAEQAEKPQPTSSVAA